MVRIRRRTPPIRLVFRAPSIILARAFFPCSRRRNRCLRAHLPPAAGGEIDYSARVIEENSPPSAGAFPERAAALPHLPGWQLREEKSGAFAFQREPGWRAARYRKALGRIIAAIVFFGAAFASQDSGLATPNPGAILPWRPELLPAMARLVSVAFALQALWIIIGARRHPTQILARREPTPGLQWQRDGQVVGECGAQEARGVVVWERRNERRRNPEIGWSALYLWLADGRLRELLRCEKLPWPAADDATDGVYGGGSDLQRAGLRLARTLGLPYHYRSLPARPARGRWRKRRLWKARLWESEEI